MRTQKAKAPAPPSREAERRRTILRAAIQVFAKKGYHGCRISDVAREAGVAYGLVYHYFHNKEELLSSVFEVSWSGFVQRVREAARGPGGLGPQVRAITTLAFEAYRTDPRAVKVLILEIARSPAGNTINRGSAFADVIRMTGRMFEDAKKRGELRADLEPTLCAASLFGAIEMGLTVLVLGLLPADDVAATGRAARQVAETFLRGVLPQGLSAVETETWKTEPSSTRSKVQRRS